MLIKMPRSDVLSGYSTSEAGEVCVSTFIGAYEPRRFWTAWDRGAATTVDVVAADWDFWAAAEVPLEELRAEYDVPAVAPDLLI